MKSYLKSLLVFSLGVLAFLVVAISALEFLWEEHTTNGHSVDTDFTTLNSHLEMYKINAKQFPSTVQGLRSLITKPTIAPPPERWIQTLQSEEKLFDPWNTEYRYRFPGSIDPERPEIISAGPDKIFDTEDDLSSQD